LPSPLTCTNRHCERDGGSENASCGLFHAQQPTPQQQVKQQQQQQASLRYKQRDIDNNATIKSTTCKC
jgi:hypothetical protein